jgi:hypothetical protein
MLMTTVVSGIFPCVAYVPSAKQRAEDERLKEKLNHPSKADLKEFDRAFEKAINHLVSPVKD